MIAGLGFSLFTIQLKAQDTTRNQKPSMVSPNDHNTSEKERKTIPGGKYPPANNQKGTQGATGNTGTTGNSARSGSSMENGNAGKGQKNRRGNEVREIPGNKTDRRSGGRNAYEKYGGDGKTTDTTNYRKPPR